MSGLEPGPRDPQPFSAGMRLTPAFDVIEILPVGPADRLRALRQHVADRHALTVPFADRHDAGIARLTAEGQLQRLLAHRGDGGFHLDPADSRVVAAQELLDKLSADVQRLRELDEVRTAAWRSASATLVNVETWLRDGRPPATVLHDYDGPPKLIKSDINLIDAIEDRRRRVRELNADLHRIRSAPFPSNHAKAQMRAQIEALAMQGAPSVSDLIEHDRKIVWPTQRVQSQVYNTGTPALAFAEVPDIALVAWLQKEALIKRLDAEIDTESDDAAALTHEARKQQEVVVMSDLLAVERDEAALVWRAMGERLPVDHRADCAPQAILQCMVVTAPRVEMNGSSRDHAIDIVHHSGQRK